MGRLEIKAALEANAKAMLRLKGTESLDVKGLILEALEVKIRG
jgi:hypothetical protein